ncbi:NYN domain-containing protein [candidate division WOR-3 bacterium]|uniref:NYN domain-containing protein n=1 Tax=candidate division WOR-3 bacterium TaxID=2052148 RepID=A0A660SEK3_UNCW3|nr:MAG: NYN domain-containing protein [candidate division WOR-3 bacterium]
MDRVVIFIDGSNFYHGMRDVIGTARIDFGRFAQILCANRRLIRVYYYNVIVRQEDGLERYKDQQRFFRKLYTLPYFEIKLGRLERRGERLVEKGVDVRLAVDMLSLAYRDVYDTAILVSGDGDFVPVVKAVKDIGKHVENAYFWKGHSDYLFQECDKFIRLTKDLLSPCLL